MRCNKVGASFAIACQACSSSSKALHFLHFFRSSFGIIPEDQPAENKSYARVLGCAD